MLVLDTDHFSELERNSAAGQRLTSRLESADRDNALTIITVEEQVRGWLAQIRQFHDPHRQITPYAKFQRQVDAFADWIILPWDTEAAGLFVELRRQCLRLGSMDLKIACISLVHESTLLTRNTNDFSKVPGLRFENWLD